MRNLLISERSKLKSNQDVKPNIYIYIYLFIYLFLYLQYMQYCCDITYMFEALVSIYERN